MINEVLTGKDLNKYEKETTVIYNELEDFAQVYSSSKKVITKLTKLGYEILKKDNFGIMFKCPKNCISFRENKPKKKRVITETHKQNLLQGKKKINKAEN